MKIVWNPNLCYACRTCQLACSFHHTRAFHPSKSSIFVSRNYLDGTIEWHMNSTCDDCDGEEEPLCVKYCVYGALQILKNKENIQMK